MSVSTGRYVVRRDGVVVDADVSWSAGPAISSAQVAGLDATVSWHDVPTVTTVDDERTHIGSVVTVDWVDAGVTTRVLTGIVDSSSGGTGTQVTSRLTDRTSQLARSISLHPAAQVLPPHREVGAGQVRRVHLHGAWFTHQALTQSGFDPGVPMHWASVWYQSMCGSVATVPNPGHAFAPFGDLRRAHRHLDPAGLPVFVQGPTQLVAYAVDVSGVTSPPRPGAGTAWQITVDLPTVAPHGSTGEIVLRGQNTPSGLVLQWTPSQILVRRVSTGGVRTTIHTQARAGEVRWSVSWTTAGRVILWSDKAGAIPVATVAASGVVLPSTGAGLCTVDVVSPGIIGAVAVTRGERSYMVTDVPVGRVHRHSLAGTSLPGFLGRQDVQAGAVLTEQADAHRGLRAQPLWQWIDADGVLVNTDFDSLAAQPVSHVVDTRPGSGALALDTLAWSTEPAGGPWTSVDVRTTRTHVQRASGPTIPLAAGSSQTLADGDDYSVLLHPESGAAWLDPDLTPLMAGFSYPAPPYPSGHAGGLRAGRGSWVGGHLVDEESGDPGPWVTPAQMGWTVDTAGYVRGAMTMLDPRTVLVEGTPAPPADKTIRTATAPTSRGLPESRRDVPLPELRGQGLITSTDVTASVPVAGVDTRHPPFVHDVGEWLQTTTAIEQVAAYLHDAVTRPTPSREATVQTDGRLRPGIKVTLRERRLDGSTVEEDVVLARVAGSTSSPDDSQRVEGVVVERRVTVAPGQPPVADEEWITPPVILPPADPPVTDPPPPDDPGDPGPPVGPPPMPSAPAASMASLGTLLITWAGTTALGAPAVTDDYAYTQVAVGDDPAPTTVVGTMVLRDGLWQVGWPVDDLGVTRYVRLRIVDRAGTAGPWGPVLPVYVPHVVDPEGTAEELGEFITVKAQNILAGTINVALSITADGSITAGSPLSGMTVLEGGPDGGLRYYLPMATDPVSEVGKDVIVRSPDGEVTASMTGTDGAVSGTAGSFGSLVVAGQDVTDRVTTDPENLVIRDDTGQVAGYGPYTQETGFREVGFIAERGHAYQIDARIHVANESGGGGSFFAYLRRTVSTTPTGDAPTPTVSSDELDSDDGQITTEGRLRMSAVHLGSALGDRQVRLLVSARGGGGRAHRHARSVISVVDLGTHQARLNSGRFSLGGAAGTPAPDPSQPPTRRTEWFDFDWSQTYQSAGVHTDPALEHRLRVGLVGGASSFPSAALLRVPDAARSVLMGADRINQVSVRLYNCGWQSGSVVLGRASTATSSPPSQFPTQTNVTDLGTIARGAQKTFATPSSWLSAWGAGSIRSLTLGRISASGFNDRMLEFYNHASGGSACARLFVDYED